MKYHKFTIIFLYFVQIKCKSSKESDNNMVKREIPYMEKLYPVPQFEYGDGLGKIVPVRKNHIRKRLAEPMSYLVRSFAEAEDYFEKEPESEGAEYFERDWSDLTRASATFQPSDIESVLGILTNTSKQNVIKPTTLQPATTSEKQLRKSKAKTFENDYSDEEDDPPSSKSKLDEMVLKIKSKNNVETARDLHQKLLLHNLKTEEAMQTEERERDFKIMDSMDSSNQDKYTQKGRTKDYDEYDEIIKDLGIEKYKYHPIRKTSPTTATSLYISTTLAEKITDVSTTETPDGIPTGKISIFRNPSAYLIFDDDLLVESSSVRTTTTVPSKKTVKVPKKHRISTKIRTISPTIYETVTVAFKPITKASGSERNKTSSTESVRISLVPQDNELGDGEPTLFFPKKRKLPLRHKDHKTKEHKGFVGVTTSKLDSTDTPSFVTSSSVKPSSVKPSSVKPSSVNPSSVNPSSVKPSSVKPSSVKPSSVKPSSVNQSSIEPSSEIPSYVQPISEIPSYVKPISVKPISVKPIYVTHTQPSFVKMTSVEPSSDESNVVELGSLELSSVKPNSTEPSFSSPSSVNSSSTENVIIPTKLTFSSIKTPKKRIQEVHTNRNALVLNNYSGLRRPEPKEPSIDSRYTVSQSRELDSKQSYSKESGSSESGSEESGESSSPARNPYKTWNIDTDSLPAGTGTFSSVTEPIPQPSSHRQRLHGELRRLFSEGERGGVKEHHKEHQSDHSDRGSKESSAKHKESDTKIGHHDKEDHLGSYQDHGGHDEKHHEEKKHYGKHLHEEHGKKHAEYEESGRHSKGHSTKGTHDVHKKEEYEKNVEFFEEEGDSKEAKEHDRKESNTHYHKGDRFQKEKLGAEDYSNTRGELEGFGKIGYHKANKARAEAEKQINHGKHFNGYTGKKTHDDSRKWIFHHAHPAKTANFMVIDRRNEQLHHGPQYYGFLSHRQDLQVNLKSWAKL